MASAWKLDKKFGGPAKSYDAFRLAITDNPAIFDEIELDSAKLKKALMDNVRRRLTPQPIKIRSGADAEWPPPSSLYACSTARTWPWL